MKKNFFIKRLLIILTVIGLLNFFTVGNILIVKAQQSLDQAAQELAQDSPIKDPQQIFKILAKIVQYTYTVFFVIAIIFIIVAAFNFLTAGGNPEKIKSTGSQIMWASIAIAIALISVGAAQIIKAFITP